MENEEIMIQEEMKNVSAPYYCHKLKIDASLLTNVKRENTETESFQIIYCV